MFDWLENLFKILFVVLFFGLSVFFHEFGHLIAAMWRGMHIEKFSIGFGKKICGFKYKGIDFIIGMLPFGGYVALPQMEPVEEITSSTGQILPPAKPLDRIIVALAGPLFNVLFAFALGTIVWKAGVIGPVPNNQVIVNNVVEASPEAKAGLKAGDTLYQVNGQSFEDTFEMRELLLLSSDLTLSVKRKTEDIKIGPYKAILSEQQENLPLTQFTWNSSAAIIDALEPDYPAIKAGLKKGDKILKINGHDTPFIHEVSKELLKQTSEETTITYLRDGKKLTLSLKPKWRNELGIHFANFPNIAETQLQAKKTGIAKGDTFLSLDKKTFKTADELHKFIKNKDGQELTIEYQRADKTMTSTIIIGRPMIGVGWKREFTTTYPTPAQQVSKVFVSSFRSIKALVTPGSPVGLQHTTSVVGMSQNIYQAVSARGIVFGLSFILMINISLAVMNLLPVPVLDGGHIAFASLELIARRKISPKVLQPITFVFVILLITLMLFATSNDIRRARKKTVTYEYVQNDISDFKKHA